MREQLMRKRRIDARNRDRDREYAELQFLARHQKERYQELVRRGAPEWMLARCREDAEPGARPRAREGKRT